MASNRRCFPSQLLHDNRASGRAPRARHGFTRVAKHKVGLSYTPDEHADSDGRWGRLQASGRTESPCSTSGVFLSAFQSSASSTWLSALLCAWADRWWKENHPGTRFSGGSAKYTWASTERCTITLTLLQEVVKGWQLFCRFAARGTKTKNKRSENWLPVRESYLPALPRMYTRLCLHPMYLAQRRWPVDRCAPQVTQPPPAYHLSQPR